MRTLQGRKTSEKEGLWSLLGMARPLDLWSLLCPCRASGYLRQQKGPIGSGCGVLAAVPSLWLQPDQGQEDCGLCPWPQPLLWDGPVHSQQPRPDGQASVQQPYGGEFGFDNNGLISPHKTE